MFLALADSFKMSLLGGEDEDGGQAKASAASKPAPEPARGPASWLDKGNSNKGNTFNSRPMTALKQAEIERKQREEEEKRADELRRIEQERRQYGLSLHWSTRFISHYLGVS